MRVRGRVAPSKANIGKHTLGLYAAAALTAHWRKPVLGVIRERGMLMAM